MLCCSATHLTCNLNKFMPVVSFQFYLMIFLSLHQVVNLFTSRVPKKNLPPTMTTAHKTSKKRPATSQAGPNLKKPHLEKSSGDKKRSRPVTTSVQLASTSDSEPDDLEDVEKTGVDGEGDWIDEDDEMGVDNNGDVPTLNSTALKDPNGVAKSLSCPC